MRAHEHDGDGVILVVGLSHQTAGLAAREQVALDGRRAQAVLRSLAASAQVYEAAVLSTCNRTEIYAVAASGAAGDDAVRRALLDHTRLGAATLSCSGYALFERDAIEHLYRVATGLESAILGETEIGAQVRAAADHARTGGTLGPVLERAFAQALTAAGQARRRTGISRGATSIGSVVVQLVERIRPAVSRRRVLLIGAGRLARTLADPLAASRETDLVIMNRTAVSARTLAREHHAAAADLGSLAHELRLADAVVCATDAADALISADDIAAAIAGRPRGLLIVDLAVPRDVDPAAATLPGVVVQDIDAVQRLVGRNRAVREHEAEAAADLLRAEADRFMSWRRELDAAPALRSVWRKAEELRRSELARVQAGLSPEEQERLDRVTASLVRKLLHGPSERLRAACATPAAAAHLDAFRVLFGVGPVQRVEGAPNVIAMPQREAA